MRDDLGLFNSQRMIDYISNKGARGRLASTVPSIETNEAAWLLYPILKALDWSFLPHSGGFLEQDEALMLQIAYLSNLEKTVEESLQLRNLLG